VEFLQSTTEHYNVAIFRILKSCYIPLVISKLSSDQTDIQEIQYTLEQLQQVQRTCWTIVKALHSDIDADSLQEFCEFMFPPELLEAYATYLVDNESETASSILSFHQKLAREVVDHSNKYWLITRSFFNQLMFTFATRPYLLPSFETFVVNFATGREIRSLDSEIKLYKLQTMLPEIIPKDYESMPLE